MLVLETARYIIDDDQDESQVSTDNKSQDDLREETLTTKSMIQLRLEGETGKMDIRLYQLYLDLV